MKKYYIGLVYFVFMSCAVNKINKHKSIKLGESTYSFFVADQPHSEKNILIGLSNKEYRYVYKDSSTIFFTDAESSSSLVHPHLEPRDYITFLDNDTITLSFFKNDKYSKVRKMGNVFIGYSNVIKENKKEFDESLLSLKNQNTKVEEFSYEQIAFNYFTDTLLKKDFPTIKKIYFEGKVDNYSSIHMNVCDAFYSENCLENPDINKISTTCSIIKIKKSIYNIDVRNKKNAMKMYIHKSCTDSTKANKTLVHLLVLGSYVDYNYSIIIDNESKKVLEYCTRKMYE